MADPTDEEQHVRPFADYLVTTNRGRTHAELTEQFADLVRAVKATGKGGKLTLTINVKPLGKNNAGQFQVSEFVSSKAPEDDRPVSIFFADDAGTDIAGLNAVAEGVPGVYGVVPAGHQIAFLDLAERLEKHLPHPSRKRGAVTVADRRSFKSYWDKHAQPSAEVYANVESGVITAVLDAHGSDEAGWAEHRCALTLRMAPAWKRWVALNNKLINQTHFAEHIEQSRTEITSPDSATLLEIAQTIQATNTARFESGVQLASGQRRFQYSETIAAKAGQGGQLEIPATFRVLLQPWVAGPAIEAEALLRYRIGSDGLSLGYTLTPDPVELREAVFDQLVREIEDDLNGRTPGEEPADPSEDGVIVHRGRYFDTPNRY